MSYNSRWTGPQIDDAVGKALVSAKQTDLTSIVATGSTNATGSTIASGTYFYLNGTLVRAKANIASGATFTSSNYEAVTVGGLNDLKAALDNYLVFYRSFSSIGVDLSATTNQIYSAMKDGTKAILQFDGSTQLATELGFASGGTIEITKISAYRGYAIASSYDVFGVKFGCVLSRNQVFWKTVSIT